MGFGGLQDGCTLKARASTDTDMPLVSLLRLVGIGIDFCRNTNY